jgi:hypothetical protein
MKTHGTSITVNPAEVKVCNVNHDVPSSDPSMTMEKLVGDPETMQ